MNASKTSATYRPWQPPAFDAPPLAPAPKAITPAPEAPPQTAAPVPPAPSPAELERIRDAAREEGYADGYEDGSARGRLEAQRLSSLMDNLDRAVANIDTEVAEELLALSVEIARLMVRRDLARKPEGVLLVVREALAQLPQHHAMIHLHPRDAVLVRSYMGEHLTHAGHRIVEDERISAGGCRVEATGSQIDATVQTRWRRILQNLGRPETFWDVEPRA